MALPEGALAKAEEIAADLLRCHNNMRRMTDAEKMAANRVVAEAVGWRFTECGCGVPYCVLDGWLNPDGQHEDLPDLFAPTPEGAWAREQVESWLERSISFVGSAMN